MKFGTDINHVNGHCCKGFQGQRSMNIDGVQTPHGWTHTRTLTKSPAGQSSDNRSRRRRGRPKVTWG